MKKVIDFTKNKKNNEELINIEEALDNVSTKATLMLDSLTKKLNEYVSVNNGFLVINEKQLPIHCQYLEIEADNQKILQLLFNFENFKFRISLDPNDFNTKESSEQFLKDCESVLKFNSINLNELGLNTDMMDIYQVYNSYFEKTKSKSHIEDIDDLIKNYIMSVNAVFMRIKSEMRPSEMMMYLNEKGELRYLYRHGIYNTFAEYRVDVYQDEKEEYVSVPVLEDIVHYTPLQVAVIYLKVIKSSIELEEQGGSYWENFFYYLPNFYTLINK